MGRVHEGNFQMGKLGRVALRRGHLSGIDYYTAFIPELVIVQNFGEGLFCHLRL